MTIATTNGTAKPSTRASTVNSAVLRHACQKAGSLKTVSRFSRPTQETSPWSVFWKARKNSRTIGYQEKNAKQRTAPIRKPCAVRLRFRLLPNAPPCWGGPSTGGWAWRALAALLGVRLGADIVAPWG